ncbi:MAG TPA: bifunctional 4-hydroxy-2-oxoglutarate aldolase/2-dehydro-3-deoxy-phosphogluconate aldolase [Roseiflexaceae bacterium]|nr:bifunctional 4-hydroxy-2-oxoglutarate aldolase/2-dehydro-3-deoxy-phosphogluconate aldolase [Roseiflexaceae bacterium]
MIAVLDAIAASRIVAIVRLERYDRAVEIGRALVAGGISALEFTLTGAGAHAAIGACREALGDAAQIGVGTVLTEGDAEAAIDAGAQFVVTPAVRRAVIGICRARSVPILCGALTPTEALKAHEAGADMVKIFPARMGGPSYIKDILAPLPFLKLVPTGGISAENARAFLEAGATAVGIGGNLIAADAVDKADWGRIEAAARACAAAVARY